MTKMWILRRMGENILRYDSMISMLQNLLYDRENINEFVPSFY